MQMGWEYLCGDVVGMVYRYVEVRAYAGGAEKWRIRRGGSVFFCRRRRRLHVSQSIFYISSQGWKLNNLTNLKKLTNVNSHGTVENVYISQDIRNDYNEIMQR